MIKQYLQAHLDDAVEDRFELWQSVDGLQRTQNAQNSQQFDDRDFAGIPTFRRFGFDAGAGRVVERASIGRINGARYDLDHSGGGCGSAGNDVGRCGETDGAGNNVTSIFIIIGADDVVERLRIVWAGINEREGDGSPRGRDDAQINDVPRIPARVID